MALAAEADIFTDHARDLGIAAQGRNFYDRQLVGRLLFKLRAEALVKIAVKQSAELYSRRIEI